jgi:hypothetical protein
MKLYTITRMPDSSLQLHAEEEVIDRAKNGFPNGSHIESEITSLVNRSSFQSPDLPASGTVAFDIGNSSLGTQALAAKIMQHYYGATAADPGATAEAERRTKPFMEAFLLSHQMSPGAKFEISSEILDRFFSIPPVR